MEEWYWEGNITQTIAEYLSQNGFTINAIADTANRQSGIDIDAERDNKRYIIEVKGYPTGRYQQGENAGEPTRTNPRNQARQYYSHVILDTLLRRNDFPDALVYIALPVLDKYKELIDKTKELIERTGIHFILVDEDGQVNFLD